MWNPAAFDMESEEKKRPKLTDSYLISLLWRFLKPYSWQLIGVGVLLVCVSGFEILLPYLIQLAVDGPITEGNIDGILPYGIGYLVTVFLLFLFRISYMYWLQMIGQNALRDMRQTLFEHIMKQDLEFFNTTPVGKIISRMSNDIEALTELLSTSIVMIASNLLTLIGIILVMFLLNWQLALISLAVIPIMVGMSFYFRGKIRAIAKRFHVIMADYQAYLNEQFNGMIVVQLFSRQQKSLDDFEIINKDYFDAHSDLRYVYTWYGSGLQLMTTFGLAAVLYGGGNGVLAGWATLGMLISFIQYTRASFDPIINLSEQFAQIQTALSAGERIAKMLLEEPKVKDPETPVKPEKMEQTVSFKNVHFAYNNGQPILKGIDLDIKSGQRIAIVGATGAGKTTMVKLLSRFYDVTDGEIQVSGVDLRDLSTDSLRKLVNVVPQSPYCFNGTIADNLRLFDLNVTIEQMKEAAEIACAAPFIERLPNTYDFELLPGGANLSEGQRQLLALARALIHSPNSVLVLDEATSNIDTETEAYIQEGLERILANRTSITIAHRLSTVRDSDRILVMKDGLIIEDGTHDELLELDGMYAKLYQRQFEELDAA